MKFDIEFEKKYLSLFDKSLKSNGMSLYDEKGEIHSIGELVKTEEKIMTEKIYQMVMEKINNEEI